MKYTFQNPDDFVQYLAGGEAEETVVRTARFKYMGLYPHVLKYALWCTKEGGEILLEDSGPLHSHGWIKEIPFAMVRYWTAKLLKGYGAITDIDERKLTLRVVRSEKRSKDDWGIGIIASGSEDEAEILGRCIQNAVALKAVARNKIYICGPEPLSRVASDAGINFVLYGDTSDKKAARFMIGAKKNFLIDKIDAEKVAVVHSRILFEPETIRMLPREFDIISPASYVSGREGAIRYLDIASTDLMLPGVMPSRRPRSTRNEPESHLRLMKFGRPYIDGSMMFFRKEVWQSCPLDPALAWGEFEDVEWGMRAWANGFLVDLFPKARVVSQTTKLPGGDNLPKAVRGIVKGLYATGLNVGGYIRYWKRLIS